MSANTFKSIFDFERNCELEMFTKLSHDILLEKEINGNNDVYVGWVEETVGREFHKIVCEYDLNDKISNLFEVYLCEFTHFNKSATDEAHLYLKSISNYIEKNSITETITISVFDEIMGGKYLSKEMLAVAIDEFKKHQQTNCKMFHDVILAAANKFRLEKNGVFVKEITLVDNCHLGGNMLAAISAFQEVGYDVMPCHDLEDYGEGFIDCDGEYRNRSEALEIVKRAGQLFNAEYVLPESKLDSSCIRHFRANKPLCEYLYDCNEEQRESLDNNAMAEMETGLKLLSIDDIEDLLSN